MEGKESRGILSQYVNQRSTLMIIINAELLVRYFEGHKPPRSSGSYKQDADIMKNTNKRAQTCDTTSFIQYGFVHER